MGAGDHLKVPRQHGLFLHHGIDLGDGTVAHYLEGREILRSPLEIFSRGEKPTVVSHKTSSEKSVTLRRALSRIGEQRYNLLFNNCEHFANWCKTGLHRSFQLEDLINKGSIGAIAFGQIMPATFLVGLKLILRNELISENSRNKAKEVLKGLEKAQLHLLKKLELNLEKIDKWIERNPTTQNFNQNDWAAKKLLLAGQKIADELNAIENLQAHVKDALINSPNKQS